MGKKTEQLFCRLHTLTPELILAVGVGVFFCLKRTDLLLLGIGWDSRPDGKIVEGSKKGQTLVWFRTHVPP